MNSKMLNKTVLIVVGFFIQNDVDAQVYVSPNSYIFATNQYVYVKQDIELTASTSNFYLRNDAQFLQGSTSSGANKGLGSLSVLQEGTVNNYCYNYWCSPVGNSSVSTGNEAFGITMLNIPTTKTASTTATILPMSNYDGASGSGAVSIAPYWIWKFVSSGSYSDWSFVGATSDINPGEGFTMKGTSGTDATNIGEASTNNPGSNQRYDFRGKPNDGTIDIPVVADELTLTGNPYSSAINLNMFLLDNAAELANGSDLTAPITTPSLSAVAYFWEQSPVSSHDLASYVGGYGVYVANNGVGSPGTYVAATWDTYNGDGTLNTAGASSGSVYKRMFCPVGQGFMIDSKITGNVQMKNTYRVYVKEGTANNSEFNKNVKNTKNGKTSKTTSSDEFWDEIPNIAGLDYTKFSKKELPQIKIHSTYDNTTRETVLAFSPNATDGFDLAKDAESLDSDMEIDTYFPLQSDEEINQYSLMTLPFDADKRIPFSVRCDKTTSFKFTVGSFINFDLSEVVFIFDKVTGVYTDISNSFYEVSLEAGTNDRFEITFKNANSLGVNDETSRNFEVYQNNTTKNVTISNPQQLELTSCGIYDIAGKLILNKKQLGTETSYKFSTSGLSDGVYIVKLSSKDKAEIGKKIIIAN
jgi:hypothetical protein